MTTTPFENALLADGRRMIRYVYVDEYGQAHYSPARIVPGDYNLDQGAVVAERALREDLRLTELASAEAAVLDGTPIQGLRYVTQQEAYRHVFARLMPEPDLFKVLKAAALIDGMTDNDLQYGVGLSAAQIIAIRKWCATAAAIRAAADGYRGIG